MIETVTTVRLRAICFSRRGDYASARAVLNVSDPKNPETAFARATLSLMEGRLTASKNLLSEAVRFGYPPAVGSGAFDYLP